MTSNVWVHSDLKKVFDTVFGKRRLDVIPAVCNGIDGYCLVSMTNEEIKRVLGTISRGVIVDITGMKMAQLKGTNIFIFVNSMDKI